MSVVHGATGGAGGIDAEVGRSCGGEDSEADRDADSGETLNGGLLSGKGSLAPVRAGFRA